MVFRKPFAFIIKHFKAFHVVIFLTSIFIMYNANQIRALAKSLIGSNVFTYVSAANYTKSPVFLISFIGLIAVGLIYWLFKVRKKNLKFYSLVIGYYLFTIVGFYYLSNQLTRLSQVEVSMDDLGLIRDISTLILLLSIPIIIVSLIRSIGFNIKQFNFSKDIKELEITDKDSEEFEILIGQNNYKYIRKIRKTIREARYVFLENIFYITVFAVIVILIGGMYLAYNVYKSNHTIATSEITTVNGVYYAVNNTYITAKDLNGNRLKQNYKYVIVNISMKNLTVKEKTFDPNIFVLKTGRLSYKPISFFQNAFNDLGSYIEYGKVIPSDEFLTGILIFEIPNSMNVNNFNLNIFKDFNDTDDDFSIDYEKFAARGINLDTENKRVRLNKNESYSDSIYKDNKVNFKVNDAYITDAYSEKYVICKNEDECETKTELIKPENLIDNTMIVVDYEGGLDVNSNYYKSIKNMDDFFNSFTRIDYIVGLDTYSTKSSVLYKDINGKAFILVDRKIMKASNVDLVFTFRNTTISIPIK